MSTIKVTNVQNPSAASAAITLDTNGQATLNGLAYPTSGSLSGRNRIINGDMRIDQRNAGSSVTINASSLTYSVDRWGGFGMTSAGVFTLNRSTTAPNGFTNSLVAVCTTADGTISAGDRYFIDHRIEGFNTADFDFGTASVKTITLSFWVQSSLTGTYCVAFLNRAGDRSYVAEYNINTANTWEYKTITVAGDTSGTWLSDNEIGVAIRFALATGTTYQTTANAWTAGNFNATSNQVNWMSSSSSRTFRITGVQLEAGSVATPFERRSYGQELALCQRYYYKMISDSSFGRFGPSYNGSTTAAQAFVNFPVVMRSSPSALEQTGTAANYAVLHQQTSTVCSVAPAFNTANTYGATISLTVASGLIAGQGGQFSSASGVTTAYLAWSAEL